MTDFLCIDICTTDTQSGLCVGCCRIQEEIANWMTYSELQKKQVLTKIEKRK